MCNESDEWLFFSDESSVLQGEKLDNRSKIHNFGPKNRYLNVTDQAYQSFVDHTSFCPAACNRGIGLPLLWGGRRTAADSADYDDGPAHMLQKKHEH